MTVLDAVARVFADHPQMAWQSEVAVGTQLDTAEALAQLKAAEATATALGDAAQAQGAQAPNREPHRSLIPDLDPDQLGKHPPTVNGQTASTPDQQPVPRFAQPYLVAEAPADIALTTPASTVLFAGGHLHATVQGDLHHAASRSIASSIGQSTSLFTHQGGIKNITQAGSNTLEAHTGPLDVLADQSLTITSTNDEIRVFAKDKILLQAGQSSIALDGPNITFTCPGTFSVKGSASAFLGPARGEAELAALPDSRVQSFDEAFILKDRATGDPLPNLPYRITRADGSMEDGVTNEQGQTHLIGSAEAETIQLSLRPLARADTPTAAPSGKPAPRPQARAPQAKKLAETPLTPADDKRRKEVKLLLPKITFSESILQNYGFDNCDTPTSYGDDHISIANGKQTIVKVSIEGGLTGADFDFICDDPAICTVEAPPALASFNLMLEAPTTAIPKQSTILRAIPKNPSINAVAALNVHVYKLTEVNVVIGKFFDSRSPQTTLQYPNADYAGHQDKANDKLKAAVVQFNLTNLGSGAARDVRYDLDGDGALSFDIAEAGGKELEVLQAAMAGAGEGAIQIAIVRQLKSYYYLSKPAAKGDTELTVKGPHGVLFQAGDSAPLGQGANQETVRFASRSGTRLTLQAPLSFAHPVGTPLEFPAAGWSSEPIIIQEGELAEEMAKWTVIHEVGHAALKFADIDDPKNIMHYRQEWTDHRLRYCPRKWHYETGTDNQWELINREKKKKE